MDTKTQLIELQKISLDIFKVFISICEKYNLKYYLIGGTLLGAVRHKGFIPWDDDIDVGMPREDYEKFSKIAQENLLDNLFWQTHITDPASPFSFGKIRNSDTTFIELPIKNFKMNHGIYIDVFPLDNYPSDPKKQKKFIKKKKFYLSMISTNYYVEKRSFSEKIKTLVKKAMLLFTSQKRIMQKKEKLYKSQTDTLLLANNNGYWGQKEIVPADWYGEGVELEFEGLKVKVPDKYDLWLTQVYGDYMQLPPVEKRVSHHGTDVIDTRKSYKEYLKF